MLKEVWYTNGGVKSLAYEYSYTASGQIYTFTDHVSQKTVLYKYDDTSRLIGFFEYDTADANHDFSAEFSYNTSTGDIKTARFKVDYTNGGVITPASLTYNYTTKNDCTLLRTDYLTEAGSAEEEFYYDDFDRLTLKIFTHSQSNGGFTNRVEYSYYSENGYTTGRVGVYTSSVNGGEATNYFFSYDRNGENITGISYGNGDYIV